MTLLENLFASGHVIDLVIGLIVLEVLVLRVGMRKVSVAPMPTLIAGVGLLLAWRFSHAGLHWAYVAAALSTAGAAHCCDLWRLWRVR
jgi:hypothetical protein